jgi:hypothetical protein
MHDIPTDADQETGTSDAATLRIRELNDAFRTSDAFTGARIALGEVVITRGVAARGTDFVNRALGAVRSFDRFNVYNDPFGEHDFGIFELDGVSLNWKIEYYDANLHHGSPNPADPAVTRRVLTVLLAEEY